MVADALDGRIDLILTKSISRFARNTVDSLTTVRKLKEKGVEVYFEKENIVTEFDVALWQATVESVRVHSDKPLTFAFRSGTEIQIPVPGTKRRG
jgi:hypothetical protein